MSFVLYLHRFFLSFIERFIKLDMGLSDTQIGWLFSVFFIAYGIGQVPGGWLSDRFGVRRMLTIYILLWSICTGLFGLAASFLLIVLLRVGTGLSQAGAYPTSATMISKWSPFQVRGIVSSIVAMGGRIGGAAAPMLTAYLLIAFVPVSMPSLLQEGEIVNVRGLVDATVTEKATPEQEALGRLLLKNATKVQMNTIYPPPSDLPASEWRKIINPVLQEPDLYERFGEGKVQLAREAKQIAKIPAADRTQQQVERLNRLLLEAVYPKQIKQIYGSGWRPVIFLYCAVGLAIALLFFVVVRDRPHIHPWVNESETQLIDESRPKGTPDPNAEVGALPIHLFLINKSLWYSSISQFATVFGHIFVLTWFPRYLAEVHNVPVLERAFMTMLPMVAGMLGMMAGGVWTDAFVKQLGLRRGRSWPLAIARLVGTIAFAACLYFDSRWGATIALTIMAFATDLGVPAVWAYNQDVGGKLAGSVLGWGNMFGCIGAAASPVVLNMVIESGGWSAMFLVCSASLGIATITALGMNAESAVAALEDS